MAFNPVNIILGLKVRQARMEKGLSLTELAARAQLSPSYVAEIEKGRKYPKVDKIMRLAEALGYEYDSLVSLKLEAPLSFLEGLLSSPFLREFPLEMFGVDPSNLVEILTRSPAEINALLQALRDIARGYNIQEEHLYRAALRSYQEYHGNYFPELEESAERFARELGLDESSLPSEDDLRSALARLGYAIGTIPVDEKPSLKSFRAICLPEEATVLLNPALSASQRKFVLAREIGYHFLASDERAPTNPPDRTDSFTQVLNDFKAAYFGGALLMPAKRVVEDLRAFFAQPRWNPQALIRMMEVYDVTAETLFYRFSELVPRFFELKVHFLRFNEVGGSYRLYKHLNMSELAIPTGIDLREHYCRRWLTTRLLKELEEAGDEGIISGVQRSRFLQSQKVFLCFGVARRDTLPPYLRTSVILGLRMDERLPQVVSFAADPDIPEALLNETCERCPLGPDECRERAAPPTRWWEEQRMQERRRDLEELLSSGAGRRQRERA